MPAKSKAQAKFMRAVVSGKVKKRGLSKKQAAEYVKDQKLKDLPERVKPRKKRQKK